LQKDKMLFDPLTFIVRGEFILSMEGEVRGFQANIMQRRFFWLLFSSVEKSNSFALGANDEKALCVGILALWFRKSS
jgi:hypothetical protein